MKPIEKKSMLENFYLILPVEKPGIPEHIHLEAKKYLLGEKSACHISVMVEKNAKRVSEIVSKSDDPQKLTEDVVALFNSYEWKYTLTDTYSLQEKKYNRELLDASGLAEEPVHMRRSIIQLVELPDLDEFYKKLGILLGVEFSIPMPHITIFAWSDYDKKANRGIGISSKEDFDACHILYL